MARAESTPLKDLSRTAYALRVLTMLRGQLPTANHDERVALVGPASMIAELVAATVRNVVDDLAELIRVPAKTDERAQEQLRDATAAVAAWVDTYIEHEALEWFNFDPGRDPVSQIS